MSIPPDDLTLGEVGALLGAPTSPRPPGDGLTLDEVGAMLRHESPSPFTVDQGNSDTMPAHARPVVWSRCDACGERVQGLFSTLHPTANKFGHWCPDCYFSQIETRLEPSGQLDLEV